MRCDVECVALRCAALRGVAVRGGAQRRDAKRRSHLVADRFGDKLIIHSTALKAGRSLPLPRETFSTFLSVARARASRAISLIIELDANRDC